MSEIDYVLYALCWAGGYFYGRYYERRKRG